MAHILPIQSTQENQLSERLLSPIASWPSPPNAQPEAEASAAFLSVVRRHWLLISGIVALALGAAYAITRMTTPIYRASTTLYFADHQGSIAALDLLNSLESGKSEVATEMEVMRSRALAG